ncbi:MAG TPA: YutD family protein [Candidatus Pelethosoma merdigallinarum]|nr:YutD family protein [Candidatus Pelethosoma merdigallinarum]
MIKINNKTYRLVEEYKNAFDLEVVKEKLTDYFDDFDYIVGDWAYGKLRLKGFCKKENKRYRPINDFTKKQDYLKNYCAPEAPYFVLEYMKK